MKLACFGWEFNDVIHHTEFMVFRIPYSLIVVFPERAQFKQIMNIQSLKPQMTLVEQAYERILDAICDGELAPGQRITQYELAESLSVSRQPVMTALGQLKQQGFVIEHGRRGLQVAHVDKARFDAIYEFRSALEPLAASLAALRATDEQIACGQALIKAGRDAVAAGDPKSVLLADVAFHSWIYETSGNILIVESMQTHWQHLRRAMGEVLRRSEVAHKVWDEHATILEFIAKKSPHEAAQALSEHVTQAYALVTAGQQLDQS